MSTIVRAVQTKDSLFIKALVDITTELSPQTTIQFVEFVEQDEILAFFMRLWCKFSLAIQHGSTTNRVDRKYSLQAIFFKIPTIDSMLHACAVLA
ncbi:hypothetical protein [Methylophaga nitratireducenticrescens]|uniref:hypothetical protein n=1 Tax=Methylophaga nitratireducenticrescens TaxID=754476 RepID=UPI00125FA9D6|nr:hypothetical protein [Methylophaga nitratireducenticrescens]